MTYFIDFDRTIFDFDAFFGWLVELPALAHIKERALEVARIPRGTDPVHDEKRNRMWQEVHALCEQGVLTFEKDLLARFVYPDARMFLEKRGRGAVIVTKGGLQLSFQKMKVEASGVLDLVDRCEYVLRDTPKGEIIRGLITEYPAPYLFVDDFPPELASVRELCPEVSLFEIRRDGKQGTAGYTVIRTLDELP